MMNFYQKEPHVPGEIYAHIFEAVCYYKQIKQKSRSRNSKKLSISDIVVLPFLELYEGIEPLMIAIQEDEHIQAILQCNKKIMACLV